MPDDIAVRVQKPSVHLLIPAAGDNAYNINTGRLAIPSTFAVHSLHESGPTMTTWTSTTSLFILLLPQLTYCLIKLMPSTTFSLVSFSHKTTLRNAPCALRGTTECACRARSAAGATERSSLILVSINSIVLRLSPLSLTVLQLTFHPFTDHNKADPGLLSPELHNILHDFTRMEKMLCSLASPCFPTWASKGGQYKAGGNVTTISQDISELCTMLPRLLKQLDVLIVRKTDSMDRTAYKDFRICKDKVFRLLHFLKEHNEYYSDITIRSPESVDLPNDASILQWTSIDCLPQFERQFRAHSTFPD